jgi:alkanesulfonate monooxygenase SsuD/methylene tetrahydromethanopterin reductase-like flavin-dependent oxidoreductase (luciferase family)
VRFGVHLPLIDFDGTPFSLERLRATARTARDAGFHALAANDHLVFARPWLDGPTALSAVVADSGALDLFTTVALPVVRGPVAMAKAFAALDVLSGGRLHAGIGPGSSARDYEAVGLDFDERWKRLDESIDALRALFEGRDHAGRFYDLAGVRLQPQPTRPVPIWVGSWGSEAGLRRVARKADGWLASAYNTTPQGFHEARLKLEALLAPSGRDAAAFPNGLATMWMYLDDDPAKTAAMLAGPVAATVARPLEQLRERLLVCSAGRRSCGKAWSLRRGGSAAGLPLAPHR